MAHPTTPVAVAPDAVRTLAFRRADGSRREFVFDDRLSSLPLPAASVFLDRPAAPPVPRNVARPFRRDNDEPAAHIYFLRASRLAVCRDGRDRGWCSQCDAAVTNASAAAAAPIMAPQRVFRDLLMSDAAEPLRPALRDALLCAYDATVAARPEPHRRSRRPRRHDRQTSQPLRQQLAQMAVSGPPGAQGQNEHTGKGKAADKGGEGDGPCCPAAAAFPQFARLPYEIRRMIWERALPTRVLFRDDLAPTRYRGVRRVLRPAGHTHSLELLWRSDLFYVCSEARRVVLAFRDGVGHTMSRAARHPGPGQAWPPPPSRPSEDDEDDEDLVPLLRRPASRARLQAGLDVLYYPWLGTESLHCRGGSASHLGWLRRRSHQGYAPPEPPPLLPPPTQLQQQQLSVHRGVADPSWLPKLAHPGAPSSAFPRTHVAEAAATLATAPISAVPYGRWASQLRLLRLPAATVALDAAWLDRAHPDTIAWAAGVDLAAADDEGNGDAGDDEAQAAVPPPSVLQVVVADLLIKVRVCLDSPALAPAQRRLLRQHIAPQPLVGACRRDHGRAASSAASDTAPSSSPGPAPATYLNGMDFTVLVGLYDSRRIEELLSLDGDAKVLNKAALHRCIACTRRAWEARDRQWAATFGPLLGAHLQALSRPAIVFSVVLWFSGEEKPSA